MKRVLAGSKRLWIEGNPYYERVEGIVAGTPSLAVYDVILDAGSSADEDPGERRAVRPPARGRPRPEKPGNLFNLTEGMLWGTRPGAHGEGVQADLDGDGTARVRRGAARRHRLRSGRRRIRPYAAKLDRSARAWKPTASDAFTAVVVMVPTMSEYFGQWKVSRFVLGDRAPRRLVQRRARGSPTSATSSAGSRVIYAGIQPAIATVDPQQAAQTKRELDSLWRFVANASSAGAGGRRFTPEQADTLGRTAQERATAIAGQVTQAAARLKVKIAQ